jgi:hypothetical protein
MLAGKPGGDVAGLRLLMDGGEFGELAIEQRDADEDGLDKYG